MQLDKIGESQGPRMMMVKILDPGCGRSTESMEVIQTKLQSVLYS